MKNEADRSLLELAAKAAGMVVSKEVRDPLGRIWADGKAWDPLTDDGDAFRLACALGLRIYPIARMLSGAACSAVGSVTGELLYEVSDHSLNIQAATRRAIVCAAAETAKAEK